MKNWKRTLALLLSLVMVLSLCACGAGDADSSAAPSDGTSAAPEATPGIEADLSKNALDFAAGMSADDVLLTVNGEEIKADLMLYWLALSCNNFMSQAAMFGIGLNDDSGDGTTYASQMLTSAVTIATYNVLLQQKAAELGCLPTDAQVKEAHDSLMEGGQENYDQMKTAFGLTDESMDYLFLADAYYDNVLNAMVPEATEEMLNDYAYQAKHILIKTVDDNRQPLPAEQVAEKKKQAEDILAQIQGADDPIAKFDELMNEFSEDGRGEDGKLAAPDGYTTTRGQMVPGFENGALALKPGEISGLVESDFGYHIILRGEVEDIQSYAQDCREYRLDEELGKLLEAAETTRAPALDALDVASFYDRYMAYQTAVAEQSKPQETDPLNTDPTVTGGVG